MTRPRAIPCCTGPIADGEQIEEVRTFFVDEAARRAQVDAPWLGELIVNAAACRDRRLTR